MPVVVIDTIKPKNNLTFPIVEDVDVLIKASGARLSEVVANMATAEQITALENALAGKASIESVTALTSLVNTKADAADLTALSATVEGKASQTDLAALQADVADKADAADLTALEAEVDTKADSSDLTTATANLQAQIDNIVTPVTQDAEVQNARVGADGTSYNTLKARLDTEFNSVHSGVVQLEAEILQGNLFDGTSYDSGYLNNLGTITASGTYSHTEIAVNPGDVIKWSYETDALEGQNGGFFNGTTFVVKFQGSQTKVSDHYEITVPSGVNKACINLVTPSTFVIVKNTAYRSSAVYNKISIPNLDTNTTLSAVNTEVQNARTGAAGTAYGNLKTRLDTEYNNIKSGLDDLQSEILSGNIFDGESYDSGYYNNLGTVKASEVYSHTEITVKPGDVIRWSYETDALNGQNGVFFNGSSFVVAFQNLQTVYSTYIEVTVPNGVNKACINLLNPNTFVVVKNTLYRADAEYEVISIPNLDITDTVTSLDADMVTVKSVLDVYQGEILQGNVFDGDTYSSGYYNNYGNVMSSDVYSNTTIAVNPGDTLRWSYETAALDGQNGVFFNDNSFVSAFLNSGQTKVDNYFEIVVPNGVNKAIINFLSPSNLIVVINTPYRATAKYEEIEIPSLDITTNLNRANVAMLDDVSYATIFRNVCCIGDSLTQGEYGSDGTTEYGIFPDYSYPAFLAKKIDANVQNLGLGGQSTKTWYELYDQSFTPEQKNWANYDAFIIFLGTNGGLDGEYDSSDDSMMGYYCKIIEMILTANAQASIFLCTSPWTTVRDLRPEFANRIIGLGQYYSLPVLRLDLSNILTYEQRLINQPYDHLLHYGRVGAMRLASEIVRCINDTGKTNPTYFNKLYGRTL